MKNKSKFHLVGKIYEVNHYIVALKHGKEINRFKTTAKNKDEAIRMILDAENVSESAIIYCKLA